MVMQIYESNQPGTIQEQSRNKELEFLKENAPSIIAGGERYEICINQIITHIDGDLESYASTKND